MGKKLFWINDCFIDKELYAPFEVEADSDYYFDLILHKKGYVSLWGTLTRTYEKYPKGTVPVGYFSF